MKKLAIASLLLGSATLTHPQAHADTVTLVNGDGSEFSALCIAAAQSGLQHAAWQHGLSVAELDGFLCNDVPLRSFVRQFRESDLILVSLR